MAEREVGSHFVSVSGADLAYTVEGAGMQLLTVGSSIYYPRTFSQDLRQSCLLVCADLPHFEGKRGRRDYYLIPPSPCRACRV